MYRGMQRKDYNNFFRELLKGFLLIIPLVIGWFLDITYWGKVQWEISVKIIDFLRSILAPIGISYKRAREILEGNMGVLITMISLFLTITSSVLERSEKKVYGLPRNELNFNQYTSFYKWTRKITYASPILMFISINLGYCVFSYIVLLYSYVFLVMHHWLYNMSYNYRFDQNAVIEKLGQYSEDYEDKKSEKLMDYFMVLENMGNSIFEENNWENAQQIYFGLIRQAVEKSEKQNMGLLCYYYFYNIFLKRNCGFAIRVAKYNISKNDVALVQNESAYSSKIQGKEIEHAILVGMLNIIISQSSEMELVDFLDWFLDISKRSANIVRKCDEDIPIKFFQEQVETLLILLERRLEERPEFGEHLERRIIRMWEFCECIYISEEPYGKRLLSLNTYLPEEEIRRIESAKEYIYRDITLGCRCSMIMTIITLHRRQ